MGLFYDKFGFRASSLLAAGASANVCTALSRQLTPRLAAMVFTGYFTGFLVVSETVRGAGSFVLLCAMFFVLGQGQYLSRAARGPPTRFPGAHASAGRRTLQATTLPT